MTGEESAEDDQGDERDAERSHRLVDDAAEGAVAEATGAPGLSIVKELI
jgi:hypothetical protein